MQLFKDLDGERVLHGFKTAFACLIGFVITKYVHSNFDQWLIITIVVVMCAQINVGSMMQKSYMRFVGTLTGSLIAAVALELFGANPIAIPLTLAFTVFLFSYIATGQTYYSDAGTLGAVTIVIILISKQPTFMIAASRFFEISLGILIAALVSQFIFPIHARHHLRILQANTLRQLRTYYIATFLTNQTENESYEELDEAIAKSLFTQRKLATDAKREPLGTFNGDHFKQLLHCEKEILRSISYMHHAYNMSPTSRTVFSSMNFLHDFHEKVCETLQQLALCIEKRKPAKGLIITPPLHPIKSALINVDHSLPAYDITYANTFLFCAEILTLQLEKLITLI